jgi:signal transduction histidine kinase
MRLLFCIVFVWTLSHSICGAQIDSLQKQLLIHEKQSKRFERDTARIYFLNEIAWQYRNFRTDSTLYFAQKALKIAQEIEWPNGIGMSYMRMGVGYRNQGNYPQTMQSFLDALRIFEKLKDSLKMANCYQNIGLVYQRRNNHNQALYYLEKAQKLYQLLKNLRGVANNFNNIGQTYFRQHKYLAALLNFQNALSGNAKIQDKFIESVAYRNIAATYLEIKDLDKAFYNAQQALRVAQATNNQIMITSTLNVMAQIYEKKNDFALAIQAAQQSIEVAKPLKAREYIKDAYKVIYEAYRKSNDEVKALHSFEIYIAYRDSLFNEENSQTIAALQSDFAMEKKQKEMELLNKERKFQALLLHALLWGFGLIVLIMSFLIWLMIRQKKLNLLLKSQQTQIIENNQILQNQNEKLEELNREKDGLVSVVAHDLRSPLNRVKALVQLIEIEGNLNSNQKNYLQLMDRTTGSGLALIRDLLDIHQIQHPEGQIHPEELNLDILIKELVMSYEGQISFKELKLEFEPPKQHFMFVSDEFFLNRILDNLVSNAIKFSFREGRIWVAWDKIGEEVSISVKDEGPGISVEEQPKLFKKFQKLSPRPTAGEDSTGLGLAIVKALVDRLKGKVEVISNVNEGSEFKVILPVLKIAELADLAEESK